MIQNTTPQESGLVLAQHARALNLSQSQIAKAIGIDQSQVSRIFDGRVKKPSNTMMKISEYLELKKSDICSTITHNQPLMEALVLTWDGTEEHAQALAEIIKSLGNFALKK